MSQVTHAQVLYSSVLLSLTGRLWGNSAPGCISRMLFVWPKDMDRNNYGSPMHNNTKLEITKVPVDRGKRDPGREITVKMIPEPILTT